MLGLPFEVIEAAVDALADRDADTVPVTLGDWSSLTVGVAVAEELAVLVGAGLAVACR